MVKSDGQPVIIDLGIARELDKESLTLTIQGMGPCTPIYAAPEQLYNKKSSIDIRTDFFSLAVISAELVLGKHPFSVEVTNSGMGIVDNLMKGKYMLEYNERSLSDGFGTVVSKLLQKEPYQRIRTYEKLEKEIANLVGEGI